MEYSSFEVWLDELYNVTALHTGIDRNEIKINRAEVEQWYKDGFTPYMTFRETWENENDCGY